MVTLTDYKDVALTAYINDKIFQTIELHDHIAIPQYPCIKNLTTKNYLSQKKGVAPGKHYFDGLLHSK